MPERLLSVISGILAGGIPGFRIELCYFLHPLTWPLVFFCGFFVLLFVRGHSHNDTQDVIMHEFPLLVAIPLLCVLFVLVWLWLCFLFFFVCLVSFVSGCVFCLFVFLLGQLAGRRTGPLPVLLWLSTSRQPCMIITIHLFAAIERV